MNAFVRGDDADIAIRPYNDNGPLDLVDAVPLVAIAARMIEHVDIVQQHPSAGRSESLAPRLNNAEPTRHML